MAASASEHMRSTCNEGLGLSLWPFCCMGRHGGISPWIKYQTTPLRESDLLIWSCTTPAHTCEVTLWGPRRYNWKVLGEHSRGVSLLPFSFFVRVDMVMDFKRLLKMPSQQFVTGPSQHQPAQLLFQQVSRRGGWVKCLANYYDHYVYYDDQHYYYHYCYYYDYYYYY